MAQAKQRDIAEKLSNSHGSFELVMSPILLGLGGWWLDSKLGTTPWILVGAAIFGVVGAVTKLYFQYRSSMALHAAIAESDRAERTAEHRADRQRAAEARAEVERQLAAQLAEVKDRHGVDSAPNAVSNFDGAGSR